MVIHEKAVGCSEKYSRHYWSGHDSRDRKQHSIQTKNTWIYDQEFVRLIRESVFQYSL